MEYKDRIKAARKHAKLTQPKLAALVGVTQTTISELETGKSQSSSNTATIAAACGVNAVWLERGIGEMLNTPELESAYQPDRYRRYPVISEVQAGEWMEICDEFQPGFSDEWQGTPADAGPNGFWLRVKNDSMVSPSGKSFPEGMLILVHPGLEVMPGNLVVAKLDDSNEATFKQFIQDASGRYLKPLNPSYRMIPINGNCRFVGRVIEAKWADL